MQNGTKNLAAGATHSVTPVTGPLSSYLARYAIPDVNSRAGIETERNS